MNGSYQLATESAQGVRWCLRRNCSIAPRQLAAVFAGLAAVSVGVATGFWSQGATLVMPFALLELTVLAMAFVAYARHAADSECISLGAGRLWIELERAGRVECHVFERRGLRVAMPADHGQWVEVQGGGRVVRIGRHLRPELRPLLVQEMRRALQGCG